MSDESVSAELPEDLGEIPLLNLLPPSMQAHLKTPVPPQLWHYTSMSAMQSIVEQGQMYATDARFLNDRDELVHAAEFADALIATQNHPPEVIRFVRQHVARKFGVFLSLANPFRNYVTCFTTHRDDLSQWRAYSGGSAGASVAFDLRGTALHPAPCVYKDEDKAALLMDIFAEMFKVGEMHFKADPVLLLPPDESLPADVEAKFPGAEMNVKGASVRLLVPIMNIIPLFKNKAFSAESEWRVVKLGSGFDLSRQPTVPDASIFYRARPDSLVPTMRINIKRGDGSVPVNELVLGPGGHPNASDAVTRFLVQGGLAIRAESSAIPYRSTGS